MSWKNPLANKSFTVISWFDFAVIVLVFIGGGYYLHDIQFWSIGYIGEAPYGDAQFWWGGALHFAQGIFQDNPGKGFRPGYFILTGLTLPVLGSKFHQYYIYFLIAFLTSASFFYLGLRSFLTRWGAACAIGLLIFNPYTAEWLATSTTDSTGLLLHIIALTCLLFGFSKGIRQQWLIAFGVFFALATLTRPLMTPFIVVVLFSILFFIKISFKQRLKITIYLLIAFSLPLILWMGIQKVVIDQWSLSSNDASAFYATSDPKIQVWNPEMYDSILALTKARYGDQISDKLINKTFWHETLKNYIKYYPYHLKRITPHIIEIAKFSPAIATHGTNQWRMFILLLMTISFALIFLLQKHWLRSSLFILLSITIYFYSSSVVCITLIGLLLAGLIKLNETNRLGMFLISAYWLTGVITLYLVGATYGPPLSPNFVLNALGYRLGCQVFFVNDVMAVFFIIWLANFKLNKKATYTSNQFIQLYQNPSQLAQKIVLSGFSATMVVTLLIYMIGGSIVLQRAFARNDQPVPYPSLEKLISKYKGNLVQARSEGGKLDANSLEKISKKNNNVELLFTGTISPFVWNMPGQPRAQLMVHSQKQIYPYTMGPGFIILEVPQHISANDWIGKQGAFIIHQTLNQHNHMHIPYYFSSPAIRAFIPLSIDKQKYAINKIIWFPITKNAAQLETNGELKVLDGKITWLSNSGSIPFQRRFFITPKDIHSKNLQLILDTSKAKGIIKLSFSYAGQKKTFSDSQGYDMMIYTRGQHSKAEKILFNHQQYPAAITADNLKNIDITIPVNTKSVEIVFNNLLPESTIWIYELNLSTI